MKKITLTLSLLLSAIISLPQTPVVNMNLERDVDEYLTIHAANKNFSGSVIVAKRDSILFRKSYGMANFEWSIPQTANTRIKVASITKTFTSAAVMMLIVKGKLSLKSTLDKYILDFPLAQKITVEHLLKHQSGVPDPDFFALNSRSNLTRNDVLESMKRQPFFFDPGTSERYSNGSYFLLAYVIEEVTGMSYGAFLKENILDPLGMRDTGVWDDTQLLANRADLYSIGPSNSLIKTDWYSSVPSMGSGFMYSTANDLLKWAVAVRNKTLFDVYSFDYPYGWGRRRPKEGNHFITQTGYNYGQQCILVIYENRYSIIFNSNIGNTFFDRVYDDLRAILFHGPYILPEIAKYIVLPSESLQKCVGEYEMKGQPNFKIGFDKSSLYFQFDGNTYRKWLVPLSENSFEMREELSKVTFETNQAGTVDKLSISFGGNSKTVCKKVK